MQSEHVEMAPGQLTVSRTIAGLMRLREWNLSDQELLAWIESCIEMGVTTFDHADIYGSYTCEAEFGRALALKPSLRDQIQLVTKCIIQLKSDNRPDTYVHHYNTSAEHIRWSIEQSLRNLQTDTLDLLLIHRPDPLMNADEVAGALDEALKSGKVRHVGVSNFTPSQFDLLQSRLDSPLITNQVELSVMQMTALTDGTLDQCQQLRMRPMIWSPLGGGAIFRGDTEQARRLQTTMNRIASEHGGAGLDQIALAWLYKHPVGATVVLGTGKLDRIQAAVAAEAIDLDRQQWFSIWEASAGHDVP